MNHNIEERLKQHYAEAGISRKVYEFGMKIETDLKERFETIDQIAEYTPWHDALPICLAKVWSIIS